MDFIAAQAAYFLRLRKMKRHSTPPRHGYLQRRKFSGRGRAADAVTALHAGLVVENVAVVAAVELALGKTRGSLEAQRDLHRAVEFELDDVAH